MEKIVIRLLKLRLTEESLQTAEAQMQSTEPLQFLPTSLSKHSFFHLSNDVIPIPDVHSESTRPTNPIHHLLQGHDPTADTPPELPDCRVEPGYRVQLKQQPHQLLVHLHLLSLAAPQRVHRLLPLDHPLHPVHFRFHGCDLLHQTPDHVGTVRRLNCSGGGGWALIVMEMDGDGDGRAVGGLDWDFLERGRGRGGGGVVISEGVGDCC